MTSTKKRDTRMKAFFSADSFSVNTIDLIQKLNHFKQWAYRRGRRFGQRRQGPCSMPAGDSVGSVVELRSSRPDFWPMALIESMMLARWPMTVTALKNYFVPKNILTTSRSLHLNGHHQFVFKFLLCITHLTIYQSR